jgi:exo-beta-1,3-glucanase (GH17 family)
MPNIHPFWNKKYDALSGVAFTMEKYAWLKSISSKPIMCKEVGFPSAGAEKYGVNMTEQIQADYYKLLAMKPIQFMYFEAFDCPWKRHNGTEDHWGLWTHDRKPKAVVSVLPF